MRRVGFFDGVDRKVRGQSIAQGAAQGRAFGRVADQNRAHGGMRGEQGENAGDETVRLDDFPVQDSGRRRRGTVALRAFVVTAANDGEAALGGSGGDAEDDGGVGRRRGRYREEVR